MFINLIFTNFITSENFNNIVGIFFIFYLFLYIFLGNIIIIFYIFDTTFLIKKYINLQKNNYRDNIINNNQLEFNKKKNLIMEIDPEFKKENFLPYKYDIKDTILHLSND